MTSEGLQLLHGGSLVPVEASARLPPAARFWVSPCKALGPGRRHSVVTFIPQTKSKPGAVALWALPPSPAPIASKSLQSDDARVQFNCDGTAVLVELSTATSAASY